MGGVAEYVARVRRLDGQWEQIGTGQDYGIAPESVQLSSNAWGPDRGSFVLKRDPDRPRLDLAHDTPIEVSLGGLDVWDGRIMEAPAGDVLSVQCEGWQYAFDDFTYVKPFVHHDLAAWKDLRSSLTAELGAARAMAAGTVAQDDGALTFILPKGTATTTGAYIGAYLDLGPEVLIKGAAIEYEASATGGAGAWLYVRGLAAPTSAGWAGNDIVGGEPIGGAGVAGVSLGPKGVRGGTLLTPRRYLAIFIYITAGAAGLADDLYVKVKGVRVSSSAAGSESGNAAASPSVDSVENRGYVMAAKSRLRADHVIRDAATRVPNVTIPTTYESASFRDEVLGTDDLYAYYRFQELAGATAAQDASGNLRHATITGGPTLAQARLLAADPDDPDPLGGGNSLRITANTGAQHVDIPSFDPSQGFAIEAVFKVNAVGGIWQNLFSICDASSYASTKYASLILDNAGILSWGNDHVAAQRAIGPTPTLVAARTYYILASYLPAHGFIYALYDPVLNTFLTARSASWMTWGGVAPYTVQAGNFSMAGGRGWVGDIDEFAVHRQTLVNLDGVTGGITAAEISDARRRAFAALRREAGDIKRTGLAIPSYAVDGRSPREAIEGVNALHGYQPQVLLGGRFRYRAQPTKPVAKIGDWPGSTFADTSSNSGRDVINSARVVGTSPAGEPIVATYSTADLADAIFGQGKAPQPVNPSFDTNLTGWDQYLFPGTLTRDTVRYDTSPASMKITSDASGSSGKWGTRTWTKPFIPGKAYILRMRVYSASSPAAFEYAIYDQEFTADFMSPLVAEVTAPFVAGWQTIVVPFRPNSPTPVLYLGFDDAAIPAVTDMGGIDSVEILESQYTVLDRQGGHRQKTLTTSQPITQAIANQLAKLYLLNNMRTPFKGTVDLVDGGARDYLTDVALPAAAALALPGELIEVSDRSDPDTGALGRLGRVLSASLDGSGKATIALDTQRGGFDALLARYGVRVT